MENENETTGQLTFRVVLPDGVSKDGSICDHYSARFRRSLIDSIDFGKAYFLWIGEPELYEYGSGSEFYYEMPYRFYDDSEVLMEIKALVLLVDWRECEKGEATIGRPEWDEWRLSVIAVPGTDGNVWRFQRERGASEIPYVMVWRRVN